MNRVAVYLKPNDSLEAHVRFRDRVRSRRGTARLFGFRLGDERFAFDLQAVEEVLDAPEIYPIPGAAPAVCGVCRHAGASLPVVSAAPLLGVETGSAETVLVMHRGSERLGLLVDSVDDVDEVAVAELRSPPFDEEDEFLIAVRWSGQELTSILDARAVVAAGAALVRHPLT